MALYSLTDEHRAQMSAWADRWIANALNCEPMTDGDREAMRRAIHGLYEAANLEQPINIVFAPGPMSGAFAAGFAAMVWWLRDHPEKHVELCGRPLTEGDYQGAIATASVVAAYAAQRAAVDAATRDATRAVDAATFAATYDAVDAATYAATRDAVDAATFAFAAVNAATDVAVDAATRDATRAVDAATCAAVDAATYAATYAATRAAVNDATRAATYAAVDAATRAAVAAVSYDLVKLLISASLYAWRLRVGGSQTSGWCAWIAFFDRVVGLDLPIYAKWRHYEQAAIHGGVRYMHEKFVIVCDRPEWIYRDTENRPHSTEGPYCRWRDGVSWYYVHGVRVPREWVEKKEALDPKMALTHENAEERRALVALIGWERILGACNVVELCSDRYGDLLEAQLDDDDGRPARFVRVKCPSSGRVYVNRVPPDTRSPQHALGWRFCPPEMLADNEDSAQGVPDDWYGPAREA